MIRQMLLEIESSNLLQIGVPRFNGKTRITRKTTEITERPKNNSESKYDIHLVYAK